MVLSLKMTLMIVKNIDLITKKENLLKLMTKFQAKAQDSFVQKSEARLDWQFC